MVWSARADGRIDLDQQDDGLAADYAEIADGTMRLNTYDSYMQLTPDNARRLANALLLWASWQEED